MKKIVSILVIALISISLVGCHGSTNVSKEEMILPDSFNNDKNYEITFWAKNDSNVYQIEAYEKAIEEFETLYPNINVNLSLYTSYPDIYNDVITNIQTKTTPNVCITYPDHIATYITGNNVVAKLDELMANESYGLGGKDLKFKSINKDEIIPKFLNECIIDNSYYALPFIRSTEAIYINKTLVNKLGYEIPETLTWDFVFEVSDAAVNTKNADGIYEINNQNVLIPFIYKSTDNMMIQMLNQLDAPYSNDNGSIDLFNDTTKELLFMIKEHVTNGAFSTFKISSYPANFLNAGQCLFAIDSTAGSTWMGYNAPLIDIPEDKLVEFETVVKPVPQFNVNNPKMISQGPSICIFEKEDKDEVVASWIFAQYLLTNDIQIDYSCTEGYIPVTSTSIESDKYQEYLNRIDEDNNKYYDVKINAVKMLLDNIDNTFVTPVFNGSASLREASGQLIEEVTKAIRRKKTVDDAFINALYNDINSLYHLDQAGPISGKKELGELPLGSKILLGSIFGVDILLAISAIIKKIRKKK